MYVRLTSSGNQLPASKLTSSIRFSINDITKVPAKASEAVEEHAQLKKANTP